MLGVLKRRKEFILCLLAVITGGLFLLFAGYHFMFHNYLSKDQIFKLVNNHQETLLNDIANNDYKKSSKIWGIKRIDIENDRIIFYCGGAGIAPSSIYYGFYYTKDNSSVIQDMIPKGNGYIWRNERGNYIYYTEKICNHFYYYEEHY